MDDVLELYLCWKEWFGNGENVSTWFVRFYGTGGPFSALAIQSITNDQLHELAA